MNVKRCEKLAAAFISVLAAVGLTHARESLCVSTTPPSAGFIVGTTAGQQAQLFDRFGDVALKDEKVLLDNLLKKLGGDKTSKIYIIVYGKKGGRTGEAKGRADRAKNYLIYSGKIAKERLVSSDHCFRAKLEFELWIAPERTKASKSCPVKITKSD